MNVTKISQKMKKKLTEYSKKYYRMRKKYFAKIIRNYHLLKKIMTQKVVLMKNIFKQITFGVINLLQTTNLNEKRKKKYELKKS